jgi:glycosyltransferase involved in cell wall biosynthesis
VRQRYVLQIAASVAASDGGPATVVLNVNRELRNIGVHSLILTTDADGRVDRLPLKPGWPDEFGGGHLISHRVHAPRRFKASFALLVSLFRFVPRADAIHVHGLYLFSSLAVSFVARVFRTPVFLQPHGVLEPYQRAQSVHVKRLYDRLGGSWAIRACEGVIFASQSEADRAADLVPPTKAHVVALGAAVGEVGAEFEPSWQPRVPRDRPVVLFLGRIAPKKRIDLLVAAWPLVAGEVKATLVIAGGFDEQSRARYEPRGPREDVIWLGHVAGSDRDALLRRAALFVLPSENENFAIAVAESLVAGTPVIVTKEVAMSAFVTDTDTGVVLATLPTASELATSISTLLKDPERLAELQAKAIVAAPELSWRRTAQELLRVYETGIRT